MAKKCSYERCSEEVSFICCNCTTYFCGFHQLDHLNKEPSHATKITYTKLDEEKKVQLCKKIKGIIQK